MMPDPLMIEETHRRERMERERRWEPVPLHAPTPMPYLPEPARQPDLEEETSTSRVIIIDLTDFSETSL